MGGVLYKIYIISENIIANVMPENTFLQINILLQGFWVLKISQNELLTYLWYLNLRYTLRDLEVILKFNNDDNWCC